ncbi:MAG TPA: hypothetical protein VIL29_08740, partial [Pseudothermotoga sp.]
IHNFIEHPDEKKFDSTLKQCSTLGDLTLAKQFHTAAMNAGIKFNLKQWNNMISMYSKCDGGLGSSLQNI